MNPTFLCGGKVFRVRHFGSKLSILLLNKKRMKTYQWNSCCEEQETLEVLAKGNNRNSCRLLNKQPKYKTHPCLFHSYVLPFHIYQMSAK